MASLDKYKLHNNTWDSDTNPSGFWEFMFLMSATVRAIKWGSVLEDYIDVKLGRVQQHAVMTPSFITDDPDFDIPSRPEGSDGEEVSSGDTDSEAAATSSKVTAATGVTAGSTGSQALNSAGSYYELPAEARELDSVLYSILRVCVRGSKRILLTSVKIPPYVQAIVILARHSDISKTDRITKAFDSLDRFQFNGDVTIWQTEGVAKIRELLDSRASIMHYILSRVMKSFSGKLKAIQYRIVEDINSRVVTDETNVFDMMQTYAVEIASAGDSRQAGVNSVDTETTEKTDKLQCVRTAVEAGTLKLNATKRRGMRNRMQLVAQSTILDRSKGNVISATREVILLVTVHTMLHQLR